MSEEMTKKNIYTPIFAKIGETPVEITEGKRTYLDLDEIPFTEIIDLCEELIKLVGKDYDQFDWFEIETKYIKPVIDKAEKLLEILL